MTSRWWRLAAFLSMAWPGVAAAQPAQVNPGSPAAATVTLDEAIARGLANSQRLAELEARSAAAAATEAGRGAAGLPILSVNGGYTRTNHVTPFTVLSPGAGLQVIYPDVPDNYRARLDLQWPIYTAGRLDALERAARAEHGATGQDLAAARADLRLEITRAFWALVTAREAERVITRSLASIDAHVADLRSQLAQGFIPPNDVLTAEAQRSRERLLSIEAANQRQVADADLERLIGASAGALEPAAMLDEPAAPAVADAAVLVAEAQRDRPERHALEDRAAAARERITAAIAAARPQVSVGGGYDYARPNPRIFPRTAEWDDSWDASITASWSIWDGGRSRAERAEATATASAAAARVLDFDRQVTFEVRQRRLEVDSSRAAIVTAADGVRAAAEAFRVVGERFTAGVATNTDLLDAQADLLQAQLDRTRALANARLADARLERAVGR